MREKEALRLKNTFLWGEKANGNVQATHGDI